MPSKLTLRNNQTVRNRTSTRGCNNNTIFQKDVIYHPINSQQDTIALQEDLDSLQRWESDCLMHFHPQKCQTMHITNKRNIIQSTYTQPQTSNNQHSQIPRYPHPQHPKLEYSHQQNCTESKHNFSLPPQKHSHMPTQNQTPSLHNTY